MAGLEGRTGSLTVGKQADIVLIDARAINLAPVHDAVTAVTLGADVSNVEAVLVAGQFRKRDGKLVADVDRARQLVENVARPAARRGGRQEGDPRVTSRHVVRRASEAGFTAVSDGFSRWSIVDESVPGAVHTGFAVCELAPGTSVPSRVNWFEESVFLLADPPCWTRPAGRTGWSPATTACQHRRAVRLAQPG